MAKRFYRSIDPHFGEAFFKRLEAEALSLWPTDERVPTARREVGRTYHALIPRDLSKTEQLYVSYRYASNEGKQPLVVLLTERGDFRALKTLSDEWSARGYVVVGMPYDQPGILPKEPIEDAPFLLRAALHEYPPYLTHFDPCRVVVVGHGKRASDAERIVQAEMEGARREARAPRVQALVLVEPEGGYGALKPELFSLPMLVVGGNRKGDRGFNFDGLPASFRSAPPGEKYGVWAIEPSPGLVHSAGATPSESLRLARMATVAFLDGVVKKDPKARSFLRKSRLSGLSKLRPVTTFR